jgi:ubiquinone/menaquinone biosynthesis C-methylase UbiE
VLARVLEPEVMDTADEARDYDAMDHSTVNRIFVDDFLAIWDGKNPILDFGTGTAQIPIELCRRSAHAQVIGIDLAEQMLEVGRANVRRAGLGDRLTLELRDAKQLPYPPASFPAVISNSIVHHIPEPGLAIAEMARMLAPGGTLLVRDLLRPADAPTLRRLVDTYAGAANAHQQKMFAESLHAALTLAEVRALIAPLGFGSESVQQTTDRHWTWTVRPHERSWRSGLIPGQRGGPTPPP